MVIDMKGGINDKIIKSAEPVRPNTTASNLQLSIDFVDVKMINFSKS